MTSGTLQIGVKVFLKRDGKYLLLRRTPNAPEGLDDKWDIPGGRINPGSTLMENLRREVGEETGLNMPEDPKLIAAQDMFFEYASVRHIVRLTYIGEAGEGDPRLSAEHTEYGWFTLEEIKKLEKLDQYVKELVDTNYIS